MDIARRALYARLLMDARYRIRYTIYPEGGEDQKYLLLVTEGGTILDQVPVTHTTIISSMPRDERVHLYVTLADPVMVEHLLKFDQ